jgi:hypothetical protein
MLLRHDYDKIEITFTFSARICSAFLILNLQQPEPLLIFLGNNINQIKTRFWKRIANGIPGNPPFLHLNTYVPGSKFIILAIPNECSICLVYKASISFLEITLIFSFQSWYKKSNLRTVLLNVS